jgi:hypothetical protein
MNNPYFSLFITNCPIIPLKRYTQALAINVRVTLSAVFWKSDLVIIENLIALLHQKIITA